jgi:hypothetical protein
VAFQPCSTILASCLTKPFSSLLLNKSRILPPVKCTLGPVFCFYFFRAYSIHKHRTESEREREKHVGNRFPTSPRGAAGRPRLPRWDAPMGRTSRIPLPSQLGPCRAVWLCCHGRDYPALFRQGDSRGQTAVRLCPGASQLVPRVGISAFLSSSPSSLSRRLLILPAPLSNEWCSG